MKNIIRTFVCFNLFLLLWPTYVLGANNNNKAVQKPIKILVNSIRYAKYDLAAKQLNFEVMVQRLMAGTKHQLNGEDKLTLVKDFEAIIRIQAFQKSHDLFKYLDAVKYENVREEDTDVRCKSTIVIHQDLKKKEIIVDWVLVQTQDKWKIIDMFIMDESTLEGISEDEVIPLLEEGGIPQLLKAVKARVKELQIK